MLRLILGIIKPHKGEVLIYGMRPQDYLKSQTIGYLPQRISQTIYEFPITVEELVKSGYERIKKHHIDWALDVFKISHLKKEVTEGTFWWSATKGISCKSYCLTTKNFTT